MKAIKRIMVLAAIGLALVFTLALTSCKGTGTYYMKGHEASEIKITSTEWIVKNGQTYKITWVDDNYFLYGSTLYYCNGDFMYNTSKPEYWYIDHITQHIAG